MHIYTDRQNCGVEHINKLGISLVHFLQLIDKWNIRIFWAQFEENELQIYPDLSQIFDSLAAFSLYNSTFCERKVRRVICWGKMDWNEKCILHQTLTGLSTCCDWSGSRWITLASTHVPVQMKLQSREKEKKLFSSESYVSLKAVCMGKGARIHVTCDYCGVVCRFFFL